MDVVMLRQAGRPVEEDRISNYFDQQRQQWFGQSCPRRGRCCAVVLTDSVKAQTDVTLSHHTPLELQTGLNMGPNKVTGRILVRPGLEGQIRVAQEQRTKQARPGQDKDTWRRRGGGEK